MSEAIRKTKTPKGELRWVIITGEGKEDLQGNLKYSASIVLDDRKQVVDMWRSLGLTCLQVADGDF